MNSDLIELLDLAEEDLRNIWTRETAPESRDLRTTPEAATILDRITQIGVQSLRDNRLSLVQDVTNVLANLYEFVGHGEPDVSHGQTQFLLEANRWYEIIQRVYVLGATAVSSQHFSVIRQLVAPDILNEWRFWIRHAVTAVARQERFARKSFIGPFAEFTSNRDGFFRLFKNDRDLLVDRLCQFDFLQCVVAIAISKSDVYCYPNFGAFYNERTQPIVAELIAKGPARRTIPEVDDQLLAEIIHTLDKMAAHAFFDFAGWSQNGWTDDKIRIFLRQHGASGP